MRVILVAVVVAAIAVLNSCAVIPGAAQVEGAFLVGTEKTLTDHVISLSSGKDCSSVRREKGLTYCVEDEGDVMPKNMYCYKTLGRVTCYDRPDPYDGRRKRLGDNDHNLP